MLSKFNLANVYVQKGFNGADAVDFRVKQETNEIVYAGLNLSGSVYDKSAENSKRYVNFRAKAFGEIAQRIQKMKIDAGANVNVSGRIDMDEWQDKETGSKKHQIVFIIEDIEYNGGAKKEKAEKDSAEAPSGTPVEVEEAFDDLPF